jgi:hypothetical protein
VIDPGTGVFTWTPAAGPADYRVTVRVTDNGEPALSSTGDFAVTVRNVAPVVDAGVGATLDVGGTLLRTGSFVDPGADTWAATVDYGDGGGDQPLPLGADKTFALSHTYLTPGRYTVTVTIDDGEDRHQDRFEVVVLAPAAPTVAGVVVNDGAAQRSMVTSLTVTFTGAVTVGDGAFEIRHRDGHLVGVRVATSVVEGRTVAVLTFAGDGVVGGSLADGWYALTIRTDRIHDGFGQQLDGDGDGIAGGDHAVEFFRLYGDTDGDGDVDNLDLFRVRGAYGRSAAQDGYLWYLDSDADDTIGGTDLDEFLKRWGTRLTR